MLNFTAILLFGLITIVNSDTVQRIYIKDNKIPVKGGDIQIVCEVSQFTNDVVRVYKTDTLPQDITTASVVTQCIPSVCLGTTPRHTFNPSSSGITITVTNLNRSEDQKYWTCAINNQGRKYTQLIVYTITPSLQYDNQPSQNQDLVQNSVLFSCRTGCAFPSPNFTWYYNETSGSRQEWSTTAPVTDRTGDCTDSEKIYTSTLTLSRYTVFTDNTDTTVKFQCGAISISGAEDQLFTPASVDVRFAVRVSTVTLKDGNSVPSNSLEVNSGEPHTLTCTSSVSRPTATIIWYFGGQEKKRETTRTSSFTFTPEYSDNQKQVYCKAFNIQSENQAVSSNIVSLYVKVKVANVTLKDGNTIPPGTLEETNGLSKTLTCTASESRPTATIIWYIGENDEKKREIVTVSTLTFTPVISDHNKQVYCKASQSGNPDVFSSRISLYVKVLATTPTITNLTTEKLEGDQIKYQCTSSQTRPVAIVTWKLGTQTLTDVQNTEHSHGNDLKSVTSIVTFTAKGTDNNKTIYCETAIPGQNLVKVQEKITVYWPPVSPVISTSRFPFLEGQTGKSIYCSSSDYGNPTAIATWTAQFGTPDSADTRTLRLPKLTYQVDRSPVKCQLQNFFTQRKGLQIQSKQVLLQVEYSPRVQILTDGKPVTTITRNEGQTVSVTCNTTGNPTPIVSWVRQQSSGHTLSFADIDRTDHGNFTCRATATSIYYPSHNFVTEEEVEVSVNYAPDVIVVVNNTYPVENTSLTIKCKPEGRPANYHFTSFVQKLGSIIVHNTHSSNNGVIVIENVQLHDSGTYICKANNGIRDRNDRLDQSGNITVNILVSPKVLLPTSKRKILGHLGLTTNITVPFYINPRPHTVQFTFPNGSVITNSSKHTVRLFKEFVKDVFYRQEVELDGYLAQLQIKNVEESDFVNYKLMIYNGLTGSFQSWVIEHVLENKPPDVPTNFILAKQLSTESSLTVTWNPGNNNGHQQTFILMYKTVSDDKWNNVSVSDIGEYEMTYTVSGLSSGTYYEIMLYAANVLGNSEESEIMLVKTKDKPVVCDCNNGAANNDIKAVIVGIVLGIIIVVVVAYAGYVTILLRRKGENTAGNKSDKPTKLTK
ncbi:hemicentin-1-like [Ruditapes philippinarum]|uniref:hemicentin-1-like n=1 Tax=Ruditapes philippinarum TaxID=129788 RepID=UPI00295B4D85|nr:hemicentin-1-like [Ruditapes philippinarum]